MRSKSKNSDKKGEEKAKRLGKVAARLFSRKGFLKTTMDEIAGAAKVSKGAMYHYFPSKAEVLFFILSNHMDLYLENLKLHLNQREVLADKIRFFVSRHLALYSGHRPEGRILLHEAHCLPKTYSEEIAKKEREYFQILLDLLSEFLGGAIPRRQLKVVTFSLFGMCNWIYSWYDPKGSVKPQELSEMICDIFFDGVKGIKG